MKSFYKNMEHLKFDYEKDTLTLFGWCYLSSESEENFQLLGDEKREYAIERIERRERSDVQKSAKELEGAKNPGFEIVLGNIRELAQGNKKLELWVFSGTEAFLLWEMSGEELLKEYICQKLCYSLDLVEMIGPNVLHLGGWVINPELEEEAGISLFDLRGTEIAIEVGRVVREDVQETFGVCRPKKRYGFEATARGKLPDAVKLIFSLGGAQREEVLEIKEMKKEFRFFHQLPKVLGKGERKESLQYLKENGIKKFAFYAETKMKPYLTDYQKWYMGHKATREELHKQRKTIFPYEPLISIVIPLYNTPLPFLKELVDSVRSQTYKNWQLCLADGSTMPDVQNFLQSHYGKEKRITYEKLLENHGISENTNCALRLAAGDYIMFCDHDDVITPDALYEIVYAINKYHKPDALYTDEDKVDMDGQYYFDPNFKPDFNLYWLRGNNYICHIFAIKKELFERVGELRSEYDGAQDFDFILRCCEKADQVVHIPKILYHWRCHAGSTAGDPESKSYAYEAGRKAVVAHYARQRVKAKVEIGKNAGWYRTRFLLQGTPKVSIIIPNKDHICDLKKCLASIDRYTFYQNYEILVVENNSEERETFESYEQLQKQYSRMRLLTFTDKFNFSTINNFAAKQAEGEYLLFLNNDTEVISPEWIEEMLSICQQKEVAAVGAKLYYPDGSIQHAGVILGMGGVAGHIFCECDGKSEGYRCKAINMQNMSAVTAACMMVKKEIFEQVGGFDEHFPVAFNDIDLCLRFQKTGKQVVFTPFAELYHYESKTRGREDLSERQKERFQKEEELFCKKWRKVLKKPDPYFSPNLDPNNPGCVPGKPEREGRF